MKRLFLRERGKIGKMESRRPPEPSGHPGILDREAGLDPDTLGPKSRPVRLRFCVRCLKTHASFPSVRNENIPYAFVRSGCAKTYDMLSPAPDTGHALCQQLSRPLRVPSHCTTRDQDTLRSYLMFSQRQFVAKLFSYTIQTQRFPTSREGFPLPFTPWKHCWPDFTRFGLRTLSRRRLSLIK